jgi:hypothetical protein
MKSHREGWAARATGSFADVLAEHYKLSLRRSHLRHTKFDTLTVWVNPRQVIVAGMKAAEQANLNMNMRADTIGGIVPDKSSNAVP